MITLKDYLLDTYKDYRLEVENLEIPSAARVFIVGPSGSGKTTLLRALSGLDKIVNGELYIDGLEIKDIQDKRLKEASVMLLTQELGLWPHMSASEHISFAQTKGKSIKEDSVYWLDLVHLKDHANKRPHELSGGQRQRLALARALSTEPKHLFLDEPFANIDPVLASELLKMIDSEQEKQGFTLVKTTHHYLGLKDEKTDILVINKGKIVQKGKWMEIKDNPQDEWTKKWIELVS